MKILVVSSYLPYPLYSGGQVRLYNLLRELSARHELTLACERRPNETDADVAEVEKICREVITVPRRKQWSLGNILKAGSSQQSFLTTGHTLPEMQKKIEEVLSREEFDIIHVETFYVGQNVLPALVSFSRKRESSDVVSGSRIKSGMTDKSNRLVLVEHNIEYKVYEKFKNRAPLPFRPLLSVDIAKIRKEEEALWHLADGLVAVSNEDKRVMAENGRHPFLVSNGVNTEQFAYKFKDKSHFAKASRDGEKRLLFIGDFKWIQNQDSVKFIIQEVWPLLRQGFGGQAVKLWIVGRSIPDSVRSLNSDPDVLFDQESSARDTQELFQEAAVLLAPIRVGGGTSYKILESMSCGTPVVTMPLSADAIEAKDGHDIMVGKTPDELADKTLQLLNDEHVYQRISRNGRALIEKNYTWKEIAKKLENVYKQVANK